MIKIKRNNLINNKAKPIITYPCIHAFKLNYYLLLKTILKLVFDAANPYLIIIEKDGRQQVQHVSARSTSPFFFKRVIVVVECKRVIQQQLFILYI